MGKSKGNKRGPKSKFKKEYINIAYKLSLLGKTDEQIADIIGIATSTFYEWLKKYPELSEATKEGKDIADANVAASLYERACGYSHAEEKIFNHNGKPLVVPTTKRYPPDTAAAFIWLKNRQGWSDKPVERDAGEEELEDDYVLSPDEGTPNDPVL